jgi:GT2 family glycosyltransferase
VDVSVIIVTRNTCSVTLEAIESVLRSEDTFSKEIIVVDNGSTDKTSKVIPKMYPLIKYDPAGQNLGFAKANNRGSRAASGELFLLLNSDARLQPAALAKSADYLRAHPECGVVGAQLLNADGTLQNSIANFPTLATELFNKSILRRLFPGRYPGKEHRFGHATEVESVVGAFLLTRRSLWEKIGGLDERYFFFLEETDYCLQARQLGFKVVHLPEVLVWHGQGQTARKTHIPARIEYWRSRYAYFQKNKGTASTLLLAAGLLARVSGNILANGLGIVMTLGLAAKPRRKVSEQFALLAWHLRGCPEEAGLPR